MKDLTCARLDGVEVEALAKVVIGECIGIGRVCYSDRAGYSRVQARGAVYVRLHSSTPFKSQLLFSFLY